MIAPSFTSQLALLAAFQPKSVWPSKSEIQPSASSASVRGFGASVIVALVCAAAGAMMNSKPTSAMKATRVFMVRPEYVSQNEAAVGARILFDVDGQRKQWLRWKRRDIVGR